MKNHVVPPRMKQLPPRRAATVAALDVGTSKIACLIARLTPVNALAPGDWRTHKARVIGIGHQRSRGVKNGQIEKLTQVPPKSGFLFFCRSKCCYDFFNFSTYHSIVFFNPSLKWVLALNPNS